MTPAAPPRLDTPVQVMFFDTDCAAVVHNLAYLRFIETNRTLLAEQLGMGLVAMARTQIYPVLVRTEIEYLKPGALGDLLVVHGWLDRLERARFWMAFEIRRPADGALLVACRQLLAVIQMPAGKPVRPPAEWREKWPELRA
jgi:YbgC/YbaW family acyl-CoA thioester hydrolase